MEEFSRHPGLNLSIGEALAAQISEEMGYAVTPQQMFAVANSALKAAKKRRKNEVRRKEPLSVRFLVGLAAVALKGAGKYDERLMPS